MLDHETSIPTGSTQRKHGWKPRIAWEIPRYEWIVVAILFLLILVLHEEFARHAGALWRDEVHSVHTADVPTLAEMWRVIGYQPHPLLMTLVLRIWRVMFSATDASARVYGVLVGLAVLAAMWWTARQLLGRRGLPLVTLLIFCLSPHNVRYSDSVRPYGLGIFLMVIATGAIWRYLRAGTTRHAVIACVAATLSVQCLYHNAFLLAALCLAGATTCASRHRYRRAWIILGVGLVAAISLIPYRRHLAFNQDWDIINKPGFNPQLISIALYEAIASSAKGMLIIWLLLLSLGLYRAARHVELHRVPRFKRGLPTLSRSDERDIDLARFCGISVVASLAAYAALIVGSGLLPGSWYYLPLLAFIAPLIDALVNLPGIPRNRRSASVVRATFAGICAAALFPQMLEPVRARQSSMDLLVEKLNERVHDNDLIVVAPWYLGLPFNHYYHGKTRWMTVPPLEDLSVHRFDLIKRAITQLDSDDPLITEISRTLNSGGSVWVVGALSIPPNDQPPPPRKVAPTGPSGWYAPPYLALMEARVWQLIRYSAHNVKAVRVHRSDVAVNRMEDPELTEFLP